MNRQPSPKIEVITKFHKKIDPGRELLHSLCGRKDGASLHIRCRLDDFSMKWDNVC